MADQKPDDLAGRLEHLADAAEKDGFLCPGCGGTWFGTRFYGQPNQERYCKTPEAPGCGWHGPETEARPKSATVPITDLREAVHRIRTEEVTHELWKDYVGPHGADPTHCCPTFYDGCNCPPEPSAVEALEEITFKAQAAPANKAVQDLALIASRALVHTTEDNT